ncbi:MAG TPA: site-specific integrase [Thermoanaerobaculia bacterium]|nr:site-specific integrase [Thermoanaerobaculia bacterium]
MARKLTKRLVDSLQPNPDRAVVVWDTEAKGFGISLSRGGVKSFVLNYRGAGGRERRYTIGRFGEWTVEAARKEARQLKAAVGRGEDPLAKRRERRQKTDTAPTVADLAARVLAEHYAKKSPSSRRNSEMLFRLYLLPALGSRPVEDVTWQDLDKLHRELGADRPFMANRLLSLASKAWGLAQRWQWFPQDRSNPAARHDRFAEPHRGRDLTAEELERIGAALDQEEDAVAVAAFKFCLFTGARPGEVISARWEDIDVAARTWQLKAAKTGPRVVILGQAAVEVLAALDKLGPWAFSRHGAGGKHLPSLRPLWDRVTARAELPDGVRLYDASRHAFGTAAAELDVDREVRKLLMGHAPGTDAHDRYTHRSRSLVAAADLVGGWLAAALRGASEPPAKVLPMRA